MKRRIVTSLKIPMLVFAGLTCAAAAPFKSQTPAPAHLEFETASIKRNGSDSRMMAFGCHGTDMTRPNAMMLFNQQAPGKKPKVLPAPLGSCAATNAPLKMLIAYAYDLGLGPDQAERRVLGGSTWVESEGFDIEAKAEKPLPEADLRTMLQVLLVDRFKLQIHHEARKDPGYMLFAPEGGAQLRGPTNEDPLRNGPPASGGRRGFTLYVGNRASMSDFVSYLSLSLGKPVVDRTQLTGTYDISLTFPVALRWDDVAAVITTIQAQLGLRLEAQELSLDRIIIDSAQKP